MFEPILMDIGPFSTLQTLYLSFLFENVQYFDTEFYVFQNRKINTI